MRSLKRIIAVCFALAWGLIALIAVDFYAGRPLSQPELGPSEQKAVVEEGGLSHAGSLVVPRRPSVAGESSGRQTREGSTSPNGTEEVAQSKLPQEARASLDVKVATQSADRPASSPPLSSPLTGGKENEISNFDMLVETLLQLGREEAARRATDDFYLEGDAEPSSIGPQTDAEREGRATAAQTEAVAEAAKNVAIDEAESRAEDRRHATRRQFAEQGTVDFEREWRREADRVVGELQIVLQSAKGAEEEPARIALNARTEVILSAVRELAARQITDAKREISAKPVGNLPQFWEHVSRPSRGSLRDVGAERGLKHLQDRATSAAASAFASANDLGGKLRRRCPSILENTVEYDDALVSLCQSWSGRR
jgi:hypothetical protein